MITFAGSVSVGTERSGHEQKDETTILYRSGRSGLPVAVKCGPGDMTLRYGGRVNGIEGRVGPLVIYRRALSEEEITGAGRVEHQHE